MDRYVLLYERILYGKYGKERRTYSHLEALIYLILKASYAEHEVRTRSSGDIIIRRGELLTSLESLAEAWKWSKGKVKRFLENDADIETKTERQYTTVFLIKYDSYQSPWNENGHQTDTKRTPNGHQTDTKRTRSNKGNKGNKGNEIERESESGDDMKWNDEVNAVREHWNSKGKCRCLKFTDTSRESISSWLNSEVSEENIKRGIDNYDKVRTAPEGSYKWTWKSWSMKDFMQRGLERFMDDDFMASIEIKKKPIFGDNYGRPGGSKRII
jgi:hypothetical protein